MDSKYYETNPIKAALQDVLASQTKREDAPCSSEAHLHSALVTLFKQSGAALSDFDEESQSLLKAAFEHDSLLRS